MKKLEILKLKVDKLEEKLDSVDTRINNLRWRRKQETINIFKKYMTPDVDGIDIKNVSERRMEFILLDDKYSSMTIERINVEDIERASWDDTLVDFKAYSNGLSLKNVEQLKKRSELQVKLAEQFEDFKDDMIAEVNSMQEKYDGWRKKLYKSQKAAQEEVRPFRKELDELREIELDKRLLKGIEFAKIHSRWSSPHYPSFDVKWDERIRDVKKLKVLRFSASKKSADLELTRQGKDWDGKIWTDVRKVNRVRVENFKRHIKYHLKTNPSKVSTV